MIYRFPNGSITTDSVTWIADAMRVICAHAVGKDLTADETEALLASHGYYFAEDIEDLPNA